MEGISVDVRDLKKAYKNGQIEALRGITFSVGQGEIFGLIGPNGAGKTTLIGCLLGLLRPDSGTVRIMGKSADSLAVRKLTGYVPERAEFEYWMTARQFLEYHHGLAKQDRHTREADIDGALELVELDHTTWNRCLKTYSRGMLQRLNLAQLAIGKPRLMLLDEPTLGLDPNGVQIVRKLINTMRADGVTAIVNSHQLDEIERLCDRVAFINKGTIGSIETIKGCAPAGYNLLLRWAGHGLNGTLEATVRSAAAASDTTLSECHCEWGRFAVSDPDQAAALIRHLVLCGLPVKEAVPEKTRLEQLFIQQTSEAVR